MPVFGDYETIGEPVSVTEEASHIATVWQAQQAQKADRHRYCIKCLAVRHPGTPITEAQTTELLEADQGLEFLEAVKLVKKGGSDPGHFLAPIHSFGNSDSGVWYATDFYARKSLKEYISHKGGVESTALDHVIYSIVAGCLALQKASGRSHGNLKASNILLAGKPKPLRSTELHLIDPCPTPQLRSVPAGCGHLETGPLTPRLIAEIRDLRAIGVLILELVEGRIFKSADEYNYPIALSPAWQNLGQDSQRWLGLCNQLLGPQLASALPDLSLETLERRFKPAARQRNQMLPWAAAAVGLVGVGLGIWFFHKPVSTTRPSESVTEFPSRPDTSGATQMVQALAKPATGGKEKSPTQDRLASLLAAAKQAEENMNWSVATNNLFQALSLANESKDDVQRVAIQRELRSVIKQQTDAANKEKQSEIAQLIANAQQARQTNAWDRAVDALGMALQKAGELNDTNQAALAQKELDFAQAMQAGEQDLHDGRFSDAKRRATQALASNLNNRAAQDLLDQADREIQLQATKRAEDKKRQELADAVKLAQNSERARNLTGATDAWNQVLHKAEEVKDTSKLEAARKELALLAILQSGESSLQAGELEQARQQAAKALAFIPDHPLAKDLDGRIEAAVKSKKLDEFNRQMTAGRQAEDKKQWSTATNTFARAIAIAIEAKDEKLQHEADDELRFSQAMDAGEALRKKRKLVEAAQQAALALSIKTNNLAAQELMKRIIGSGTVNAPPPIYNPLDPARVGR